MQLGQGNLPRAPTDGFADQCEPGASEVDLMRKGLVALKQVCRPKLSDTQNRHLKQLLFDHNEILLVSVMLAYYSMLISITGRIGIV